MFSMFSMPLWITSTLNEPVVTMISTGATVMLAYVTLTKPDKAGTFDQGVEKKSIDKLVTTTPTNRLIRATMGVCHTYAAVQLSRRYADGEPSMLNLGMECLSLLSLCTIAVAWFSTGYNGQ